MWKASAANPTERCFTTKWAVLASFIGRSQWECIWKAMEESKQQGLSPYYCGPIVINGPRCCKNSSPTLMCKIISQLLKDNRPIRMVSLSQRYSDTIARKYIYIYIYIYIFSRDCVWISLDSKTSNDWQQWNLDLSFGARRLFHLLWGISWD